MKQILKRMFFLFLFTVTSCIYAQTEINTAVLKKTIKPSDILVVQYYDSNCSACKLAKPMYKKLANNYSGEVSFLQIDISKSNVDYGVKVTPTYQIIAGAGNLETLEGNPGMYYLDYIIGATVKKRNESGLSTGNIKTTLSDLIGLNGENTPSNKKLLLEINGGFEDPGPPDAFQIFDFCEQLRDEKNVFGFHTEKIFINYLDDKILGIKSVASDKTINDQPYIGYLKKHLHTLKCDTRVISALSMRETSSFFKHIVDIGRTDYFNKFYLGRCDKNVNGLKPKLDVNQYELIDEEKETLLDFVIKNIEYRKKFANTLSETSDDLIKLQSDLIKYCDAKKGSEL
ncbi:thioredoxin domain-containing protein [Marixanthomonas ophiurae]|uniref:Thioredoxin domain-containing protein n=1 Tax=Marixanthomonas ophiurae TaxID=387659 RepID=A0A3E1Q7Q2_9FLAO|nr:thioredoxin domain-containing protein [Marixanthomonas ophiurae]RFN58161.1 hypothetical protein DZ858_13080 [Marixanthomonas ophiurae]